jgi:cytochrome c553
MATLGFVALFVLLGAAVLFIAFSGGPGRAREAYLTRGGRLFRVVIPVIYIAAGITIPAVVIADREEGSGGSEKHGRVAGTNEIESGKELFRSTCASCHSLAAVQAHGVTGPDLDEIAPLEYVRVYCAIYFGGTAERPNTGRMPAALLQGSDQEEVAAFVSQAAGDDPGGEDAPQLPRDRSPDCEALRRQQGGGGAAGQPPGS